jgi:DNA-binding transcriptional LysR family regulator
VSTSIELRQLGYFVEVAEELHFGRAAERLHMSQSPLSRAIHELERDLGVVLFVRTTRSVELTASGSVLLERSRRALAEIDGAVTDVRRAAKTVGDVLGIGYGPFSRATATRIAEVVGAMLPDRGVRLEKDVTPNSLRRVGALELDRALVMETRMAVRRHGVRVDTLKDEPLLVASPASHRFVGEGAMPVGEFAAERVLLPREPPGQLFNSRLRTLIRAHGFELERTMATLSAPWDRRMLPIASGEAVSVFVSEWVREPIPGVAAAPFDPPLSFPVDLASAWPPSDAVDALVRTTCALRDAESWVTQRAIRSELPPD